MPRALYTERYQRFLKLLKDSRKQVGLTQAALAKKLGKPQSFVAKYERGERRLDVLEFLDVTAAIGAAPQKLIKALLTKG